MASPSCPEILIRSARGLILLPPPYRDLKQAKELLDRALAMHPDHVFGHHVMAQYFEKIKVLESILIPFSCTHNPMQSLRVFHPQVRRGS